MINLRRRLLIPIRRLTFAFIAFTTLVVVYLGSASSSPASAPQRYMQDMQQGPVHYQKPSSSLVAANPVTVNTFTVEIENFEFKQPENVLLKKGGKVTFINKDSAPHTVTPLDDAKFTDTGSFGQGESKIVVFNTVGVQNYFCAIHPSMTGKSTVVK